MKRIDDDGHDRGANLPRLTSLRWFAAFLVFLHHFGQTTGWRWVRPFGFGYVGVTFFFVLSGFVLTWSATPLIRPSRFYRSRFARVFPAHFFVLAAILVVALALGEASKIETGTFSAMVQVALIQSWWPTSIAWQWNGVSWSLSDEAFFYALFPLLLWGARYCNIAILRMVLAAVLLAGVGATCILQSVFGVSSFDIYINPLIRLPEFILGICLALEFQRGTFSRRIPMWFSLAICATAGVICWRVNLPFFPLADYVMLPGFLLLVISAAQADQEGLRGLLKSRLLVYLGTLSFAFYLVHLLLMRPTLNLLGWNSASDNLALVAGLLITCGVGLVAAIGIHHLIEKPSRTLVLRRSRRASEPAMRVESDDIVANVTTDPLAAPGAVSRVLQALVSNWTRKRD